MSVRGSDLRILERGGRFFRDDDLAFSSLPPRFLELVNDQVNISNPKDIIV
jgi:hypothetical protein